MPNGKQITKAKMLELYEKGLVTEVMNAGDRIYARSVEGQNGNYIVVWCSV